jgi:hypothetical protein
MRFRRKRDERIEALLQEPEFVKHSYMLSGVEASGTMVFVCRNCIADLRIERSTMFGILVERKNTLDILNKHSCPRKFPDGLVRILPDRAYQE